MIITVTHSYVQPKAKIIRFIPRAFFYPAAAASCILIITDVIVQTEIIAGRMAVHFMKTLALTSLCLLSFSLGLPTTDQPSVYFETPDRVIIGGRVFEAVDAAPSGLRREGGGEGEESGEVSPFNIAMTLGCVVCAALAAGLTMGLVSATDPLSC